MPNEEDYGLDFGPAPGMGLPRLKPGTVSKTMKATPPRSNPAAIPSPGEEPNPQFQKDQQQLQLEVEANMQASQLLNQPVSQFGDTPEGLVKELVVNRGHTMGQALDTIQSLYSKGSPYVKGLPGIDEFVNKIPGTVELTGQKLAEDISEPIARFGAGINYISKELGGPEIFKGAPNTEQIDKYNTLREETRPSNLTSDIIGALPGLYAFGEIERLVAPVSTSLGAMAVPGAAEKAINALTKGGPLTEELVRAAGNARIARWLGKAGAVAGASLGYDVLYGKEPSVSGALLNTAGAFALNRIIDKVTGRPVIDKALEFLSRSTGTPIEEITTKVTDMDQMLRHLDDAGAPAAFVSRVIDAGRDSFGDDFGRYVGRWAARSGRTPEELQSLLDPVKNKDFHQAAVNGYTAASRSLDNLKQFGTKYEQTANFLRYLGASEDYIGWITKDRQVFQENAAKFFGRRVAQTGEAPDILYDLTKDLRPKYYKTAIDEYNDTLKELGLEGGAKFRGEAKMYLQGKPTPPNTERVMVVEAPFESPGGNRYFPPMSKWHINQSKLGPANIIIKDFKNPIEVQYQANQIPAYALISRLKGNPKLSAAVLQTLNNKIDNLTGIDFSTTNNVIDTIAARLAKRMGHDSVIYRGLTSDKDIYVDLSETSPLEASAEKIVDQFEKSLAAAGRRALGKNFLSIALPIAGIGAGIALNPRQSEAAEIPVEGIAKIARGATSKIGKFLEGFTELITPESKALRPPSHLDFRSPEYNPTLMPKAWGHEDIAVNLLSGEDKADLVKGGYVRALREDNLLGLEFNPEHEVATKNALDFLRRNYRLGDTVRIDRGNQSGEFFLPGQAAQFIRKGIVPAVGIGLGILATQDQSQAIEVEPLIKAAGKFKTIGEFVDNLAPEVGQIIKQIAAMTGESHPAKLVETISKVRNDVHNLSGGAKIEPFDLGPNYVGVNVTHRALGPFPLVTINGVVDPDTGTWFPEVKSSPIGFGKNGLQKVFETIKKQQPLISKLKPPNSLLGILAATVIGKEIYDLVSPSPVEAAEIPTRPILDMLGKGLRGAGEGALEDIARSKSVDDLTNATLARIRNIQSKARASAVENISSTENSFLNFDNNGNLTPESQQMLGSADSGEGMNSLFRWRPPWSASEHPYYQGWYNQLAAKLDAVFRGEGSTKGQLLKRGAEILKEGAIPTSKYDELNRAVHGLRRTSNGGLLQTEPGISNPVNEIAKKLHDEIVEPLWKVNTSVDPRAVGIMNDLGIEQTRANWELIKAIQDRKVLPDGTVEPLPRGAEARHVSAAQAMTGMINTKPWQWKNLEVPYAKAKYSIIPVENERAALTDQLKGISTRYGNNPPPDVKVKMLALVRRLKELDVQERKGQIPLKPRMDVLHKQKFTPFDEVDVSFPIEETDPQKILASHIHGSLERMFFDEQNHYTQLLTDYFEKAVDRDGLPAGSRAIADYMREFMNTINGLKAMRGDSAMVQQINAALRAVGLSGHQIDIKTLRKWANNIMEFTWITKMGFGLRFPIVNSVQPLQTTAMITGYGPLARAYAKVINNPGIWDEALSAKVMRLGESRAMSELENKGAMSAAAKAFDWIPNKSENLNRVVSYQAAKDHALDQLAKTGTLKVPKFVRTFNKEILSTGDPDRIAKEYAAAVVRTTQFMFGPEGRPLLLSGGSARKVVTQFKSFTAAYADLLLGAIEHAKQTKDVGPLARGLLSLILVGGVGTVLPYEVVRRELVKRGVSLPQDQAGLGYLIATAASTFGQPETAEQVKQALQVLPQLSGSFSPLNLPNISGDRGYESLAQFVAGPTLGSAAQAGKAGLDVLMGQKGREEGFREGLRAVSPLLASIPEGVQMAGNRDINDVLSRLGYRGGIYSQTGKLLAKNQGLLGALSRALNLQPSLRSQRYKYLKDIQSALEGGQSALAQNLLKEAQRMGFIFDKKDFGSIKGAAKRKENVSVKPNEPLR